MKSRLLNLWDSLTTNFWLLPALMAAGAIAFAFFTNYLDTRFSRQDLAQVGWIWTGSPEGARQVLSTIASSMITVAGVTFSITIVALAQASSQYGPLLLRNFLRDTGNQFVLGTFIATFIYCLMVLRTIHGGNGIDRSVPHVSVTVGIILALASLAVLIYFIHHACESLEAENIVARIGRQLEKHILAEFPPQEHAGSSPQPTSEEMELDSDTAGEIHAPDSGYVQLIDFETLIRLAASLDTRFVLRCEPGDFVAEGNTLLKAAVTESLDPSLQEKICGAFILGRHRTPVQDTDYAVHQLVEIAVRALSPGVNDPFTAVTCVDWLGSALNVMTGRSRPPGCLKDKDGTARVLFKAPSFRLTLDAAFNQIRQNARANAAVSIRLLETLGHIARRAHEPDDLQAIADHTSRILADCEQGIENAWDLAIIHDLGQKVFEHVEEGLAASQNRPTGAKPRNFSANSL